MRIELSARPGLKSIVSTVLLTFSAVAYASEPKPRPTALDPSNPAAPAGEAGSAGNPQATVYTCPMHPEVIADKPGRCPKCGMKLVPKEPAKTKTRNDTLDNHSGI